MEDESANYLNESGETTSRSKGGWVKTLVKVVIGLILLLLCLAVAGALYFRELVSKPYQIDQRRNIIEIKNGEGIMQISTRLRERNLIKSDWAFVALAKLRRRPLLAGIYQIKPESSTLDVYDLIVSGQQTHKRITIPEGYRLEQIGQVLANNDLVAYDDFVKAAEGREGSLFPDTYFFPLNITAADVVSRMESNFAARTKGLTVTDEDLIIASIVEREAIKDEERALIAGVYKNRVARGMKLEADPTVQYGRDNNQLEILKTTDQSSFKFWQSITIKDYHTVISPYNTYEVAGLPVGPICNPGLASIEATVNYQTHDYLFFLHKDGQIYPSKTEEEHNQNRARVLGVKIKQLK